MVQNWQEIIWTGSPGQEEYRDAIHKKSWVPWASKYKIPDSSTNKIFANSSPKTNKIQGIADTGTQTTNPANDGSISVKRPRWHQPRLVSHMSDKGAGGIHRSTRLRRSQVHLPWKKLDQNVSTRDPFPGVLSRKCWNLGRTSVKREIWLPKALKYSGEPKNALNQDKMQP